LCASFSKGLITPAPLIPIFLAATAIGTAATVAGLGIQGAQHHELIKQLPEQKKFLDLQVKLAEYQLHQYEEDKKAKEAAIMFKSPPNMALAKSSSLGSVTRMPVTSSVMTRSMTRTAATRNLNMPMQNDNISRSQGFSNPQFNSMNFGGSAEGMQMTPLRASNSPAAGSLTNLNSSHSGLLRVNNPTLRMGVSNQPVNTPRATTVSRIMGRIRNFGPSIRRLGQRMLPVRDRRTTGDFQSPPGGLLGRNTRIRFQGGNTYFENAPDGILGQPSLTNRFRRAVAQLGNRIHREPYRAGFRPTFHRRVRNFMARHKRKLAIAGGILAGGAIIGSLAGGLTEKETMHEGNMGVLSNIIKGGGGGGGGGGGYATAGRNTGDADVRSGGGLLSVFPRKKRRVGKGKSKTRSTGKCKRKKSIKRLKRRKVGRKVGKKGGHLAKGINKKRRRAKKRFVAF
jgi:hypothetical protein